MACIYRIINPNTYEFYVGQDGGDDFERITKHIQSAFSSNPDASAPLFKDSMLKDLIIDFFPGPVYGLDGKIYKEFFSRLIPEGKRTQRGQNEKYTITSPAIENPTDEQKRDAAEILHTFYLLKNGYISLSKEAGGQYKGGWRAINVGTRLFSTGQPQLLKDAILATAYRKEQYEALQKKIDKQVRDKLFAGSDWNEYMVQLIGDILQYSLSHKNARLPELKTLVSTHLVENYLTDNRINNFLDGINTQKYGIASIKKNTQEVKKFISITVGGSTSFKIKSKWKAKDLKESIESIFNEFKFFNGLQISFPIAALFEIQLSTSASMWWGKPSKPETSKKLQNELKRAAVSGMKKMMRKIDKATKENFYWSSVHFGDSPYGFASVDQKTLSLKLKEKYSETFSSNFFSNWNEYYRSLISFALPSKKLIYSGEETKDGRPIYIATKNKYDLSVGKESSVRVKTYRAYAFNEEIMETMLVGSYSGNSIPDSLLDYIDYY